MSSDRGIPSLSYRRLAGRELDLVLTLDFDVEQVERYLGPLRDIIDTVRRGPAHQLVGIEEGGALVGFFAIHPDRRDASRWWLGWFGIDRSRQGGGRGARVVAAIMARLRQIPACREVRLLVAPDNESALRLYRRAGFVLRGLASQTNELVMRCVLPAQRPLGEVPAYFWANAILIEVVDARTCRMGVPVAAQLHGEVAHPP